jgi:hypothetical protein
MLQTHYVRREMVQEIKKDIPLSELTLVTMTSKNKHELNWRDKHEFRYKGTLYDVVKTRIVSSEITEYYCITDHMEMKLLSKLEKQRDNNSKQDKNNRNKGSIKLFFNLNSEKQKPLVLKELKSFNIPHEIDIYNTISLDIPSPPPNVI